MTPTIRLVCKQTVSLGCDPQQLQRCLQQYVDKLLGPAWAVACTVLTGDPTFGDWPLYFLDNADQAGDLGYHEDDTGVPRGYVFVKSAAQDGTPTSVVASHELAELLVDPGANLAALSPRNHFVALEPCDPVQGVPMEVAGLPVSDFVLPSWFGEPGSGPYDAAGGIKQAWELSPGGYVLLANSGGWSQLFGSLTTEAAYHREDHRLRRLSRRRRLATPTAGSVVASLQDDGLILV
jgi:hypothetical protein